MNILKTIWEDLKNNKWLLFALPPLNGLFILFFSWKLIKIYVPVALEKTIFKLSSFLERDRVRTESEVKLYESKAKIDALINYYIAAWFFGFASVLVFGTNSIASSSFVTLLKILIGAFNVITGYKLGFAIPIHN